MNSLYFKMKQKVQEKSSIYCCNYCDDIKYKAKVIEGVSKFSMIQQHNRNSYVKNKRKRQHYLTLHG